LALKQKICFIINPVSGIGKQKKVELLVERYLDKIRYDFVVLYTDAPKHASVLAKEASEKGYDAVVAVGGDGSLNEVAKGLIGSNTKMGIIPAGSGNGLARNLNIPLDLKKAIQVINNYNTTKIDTGTLNGEPFLNVAGIGFDAHISWMFSQQKKRGFFSYVKLTLKEFPRYVAQEYNLIIDDKKINSKAFLISFANGAQWGGGAYISPDSIINDGKLEVAILKNVTLFNFPKLAYMLLQKKLHQSHNLQIISGKKITVMQNQTIAHIDGESIKSGNSISIEIKPLSLNVIVP
jgi:diacylglycerol kinase (ATP)